MRKNYKIKVSLEFFSNLSALEDGLMSLRPSHIISIVIENDIFL
jgi:hypothetical protein